MMPWGPQPPLFKKNLFPWMSCIPETIHGFLKCFLQLKRAPLLYVRQIIQYYQPKILAEEHNAIK